MGSTGMAVFAFDLMEEFRANDRSPGTGTFILGGQMKTLIAGLALVVGLVGCDNRGGTRDTGRVDAADTTVTTQDTTIVTADTSVDVDTTVKEGDVKRPANRTGRDTATTR